jgi:parallel beta-helix repeat protein
MIGRLNILKLIIFFVLLVFSIPNKAATYYFSSSIGSDIYSSAQAQNQATPWQTISKLNSIMNSLLPGDMVLFKRGDTFSGTITVGVSGSSGHPITFGAYGSGNSKVILDNRLTITGWVSLGGNIWEASNPSLQTQPTSLFVDNKSMPLGRYPNSDAPNGGYLTVSSHPAGSKTVFTDNNLPASPNWTGAEVVLRNDHYLLDRLTVASQSGKTITLSSSAQNEIIDKFGYFFQNHPSALDREGEWCYIASTKKLRLYSVTDPNTKSIKVANTDNYFNIISKSYLIIDGFGMYGAKKCAVALTTVTYCTIKNCEFNASGTNAINIGNFGATDNDSITISNNSFLKTQSNCINAYGKRLSLVGNTFTNTGMVPGMAESGQYSIGINILANGLDIERNVFDSTGYAAITFLWSSNILIKENVVNHFCMVLDDGGGIYCWQDTQGSAPVNRKIINNIVLNGIGAINGTDGLSSNAEGIYIDDRSSNVEITGNTVAYCSDAGIYIHNSPNCTVKNNTMYSCKLDMWLNHDDNAPSFPITNADIENNLFATIELDASRTQLFQYQTNDQSPISNIGILDNNIYCQPFLMDDYIEYKNESAATSYSKCIELTEWKALSGLDTLSKLSPIIFPVFNKLLSANGISNGTFSSNKNGWDSWDPSGNTSTLSVVNGQLDGGALAFTVSGNQLNNPSRITTILPPITAGKTYMLKFSNKSTITGILTAYLIEDQSPYTRGSDDYHINICSTRAEKYILFTATASLASPSLFILSGPENGTLYIDNVEFYEITPTNPLDYLRFEYNATSEVRNITADRNWITPAGISYASGSSITIPPFSSVVLLKSDVSTGIVPNIPAVKNDFKLFPNPTDDKIFFQTNLSNHSFEATLFDISGREIMHQTVNEGSFMDVRMQPPGLYLIRIIDNSLIQVLEFIKK